MGECAGLKHKPTSDALGRQLSVNQHFNQPEILSEAPSWLSHLGEERVQAPWGMSRYYHCICGQQAREVKFWESITLDLEFSRQLRKSLQIPRREERIKGLFLEVLISKRRPDAVAGHQGAGGDTETLGSRDTSFPSYKEHLDFSQEFIFTLTDSEASLGFSSSGRKLSRANCVHPPVMVALISLFLTRIDLLNKWTSYETDTKSSPQSLCCYKDPPPLTLLWRNSPAKACLSSLCQNERQPQLSSSLSDL